MPGARAFEVLLAGSLAGLAACAPADGAAGEGGRPPDYLGATVEALNSDLIAVKVEVRGGSGAEAAADYARCVAAAYALENDQGFVRHVRTLTDKEGGIWRADAVYSVTPALPEGLRTIDAEVTAADCADRGVPTAFEGLGPDG
jgi:hypothetical protein